MRVLVVGGSGYVGRLVLPTLAERFSLAVYDRVPPADPAWEYIEGDVTDPVGLEAAAKGRDALLYMAMGKSDSGSVLEPVAAYMVNALGVHLAMNAAVKAGMRRAVYTSSLSVHDGHDLTTGAFDREEVPAEPRTTYGHTKLMGEEVCRFFHRVHELPILVLRLFMPVSQEQWRAQHDPSQADCRTSAPDLARAMVAALEYDRPGFEILHITGDTTGQAYHHDKARRLLGWEPLERV